MQDNLRWEAQYNDGTILSQISPDGTKNAYEDIDRPKLIAFLLRNIEEEDRLVFAVSFAEGDGHKLIWRRRVQNSNGEFLVVHIVGKKHQFVAVVQDSVTLLVDNFNEDDALLAPPDPVKGE